jgi:hypothetical protein
MPSDGGAKSRQYVFVALSVLESVRPRREPRPTIRDVPQNAVYQRVQPIICATIIDIGVERCGAGTLVCGRWGAVKKGSGAVEPLEPPVVSLTLRGAIETTAGGCKRSR